MRPSAPSRPSRTVVVASKAYSEPFGPEPYWNERFATTTLRPMARPKSYERDTVLIAARDVFWERGYEATSIAALEERTGLSRSSLYEEFGSKRDLFQAALE